MPTSLFLSVSWSSAIIGYELTLLCKGTVSAMIESIHVEPHAQIQFSFVFTRQFGHRDTEVICIIIFHRYQQSTKDVSILLVLCSYAHMNYWQYLHF